MTSKVSDEMLTDFVARGRVTPQQVAAQFKIARSTAMRRMCKLEAAGRVEVVATVGGGYLGSGSGRNLTYYPSKRKDSLFGIRQTEVVK